MKVKEERKIKKIELKHKEWGLILQTMVYVLITLTMYLIGYYTGKGAIVDVPAYIAIIFLVIFIIIMISLWKMKGIRDELNKGQAQLSIIIAIGVIALIFLSLYYGGFENLWKEFFVPSPYIKFVKSSETQVYAGDRFYLYYTIRNPTTYTFTPQLHLNYSKACFSSDIKPTKKIQLKPLSPKDEAIYYTSFTVIIGEECYGGFQEIELLLFNELNNLLDKKSVGLRLIRAVT